MSTVRLSREMENEILQGIHYSREQLEKDKALLKVWLKEQKFLPQTRLKETDTFLEHFLVGCKGSLETVKKKLDAYYTLRSVSPLFHDRDNTELQKQARLTQFLWVPLEHLPDGTLVYMIGGRDKNLALYDPESTGRRAILTGEYMLRKFGITRGLQVLIDIDGFSTGHALKTSPTILRSILTFLRDAFPISMKKCILFNAPGYVETMVNTVVRPFLTPKLQERLIVTKSNIDAVFEYVDRLPSTYGGKEGDILELADQWEAALESWDYLPNIEEVVDEEIRPNTTKDRLNPYFGMHGSIKALVID